MVVPLLVVAGTRLASQSAPAVARTGDNLHLEAPGFRFIQGDAQARLKDGRSLRFEFDIAVLDRPGAPPLVTGRERFNLSYDVWEERFAVTRLGPPSEAISHLTARQAEAWCLERVAVPVAKLAARGANARFWIRIAYTVPDTPEPQDGDQQGTLRLLIDMLSRRREPGALRGVFEAGSFRLPDGRSGQE